MTEAAANGFRALFWPKVPSHLY